ncbi:MAG: zf-HC2 domain-containing protein [Gemmatimonadaceae bacterium]|jgi:hypothetical protein|nr:zf-HC2 domain-containing protein [Gemmatimonadaceae bacterium]
MTDRSGAAAPRELEMMVHCADLEAQLTAYGQGTLSDAQSRAIERHVAACRACERRVDAALAAIAPFPMGAKSGEGLVAAHPLSRSEQAAMRRNILARITPRRSLPRRGPTVALVALAASLAIVVVRRASPPRGASVPETALAEGDIDSSMLTASVPSAPMAAAERLARAYAAPEFEALDRATRELSEAMRAAPHDAALRTFRVTLDERRRELTARIARVGE